MLDKVQNEGELYSKYGELINTVITKRMRSSGDAEKVKGEEFVQKYLKENPTATKTNSGLVYHELTAGSGKSPSATDTVLVHYHGTRPNGKVFDSSVDRKEPIEFPLNQVIPAWTEGVALMKVGGKSVLVCPSDIAYGDQGSPPVIPPGATLVFTVELLQIK